MIHISKMTGKLEGFQAISTNTVTNAYCNKNYNKQDPNNICTFCYSNEMLKTFRKNMAPALQRNTELLADRVLHPDGLPVINSAFFRFNAHGELINEIIAKYFKKNDKPKNFILIYSTLRVNHILVKIPPYFDKTFSTVPESQHQDRQNCTGQKCKDCLLCYKLDTPAVIVEKVKTYGKKKFKKAGL